MLKIKQSKKIILLVGLFLLIVGIGGAWAMTNRHESSSLDQGDEINYGPPTEEEKQSVDDNKERIVQRDEQLNNPSTPSGSKKSVKPVITSAEKYKDNVEVSSFVPNIFEDDGKCTANFSKGTQQFSKQVTAVKEGRAVYCPLISVSTNQFPENGEWNVSVTYTSLTSSGTSDITKFEVN